MDLLSGQLLQLEGEGHILTDVHVRIEGVVLEDHGHIPILGKGLVDQAFSDEDLAFGDLFQSGDHPQGGRLAAAAGTDEDHEFPVQNSQRKSIYGHNLLVGHPEFFKITCMVLMPSKAPLRATGNV